MGVLPAEAGDDGPTGTIHFHLASPAYCDDFGCASLSLQGHFIHEMTHVWQHQAGVCLPGCVRPKFQ
jgi:hypothetical protein